MGPACPDAPCDGNLYQAISPCLCGHVSSFMYSKQSVAIRCIWVKDWSHETNKNLSLQTAITMMDSYKPYPKKMGPVQKGRLPTAKLISTSSWWVQP